MLLVFIGALLSFCITFITIPIVINVAELKRLYDEPGFRKAHKHSKPNLGGFVIFASVIFSTLILIDFTVFSGYNFILAALLILYFIGIKDDILVIAFHWKLLGQIFAALLVSVLADIRLTSFYGLFGVYEINYFVSILVSAFLIILIINSFNLIDGIDCLASTLGILAFLFFGVWFLLENHIQLSILTFSIVSALAAFMYYNYPPSKLFMGDTGSLTIGLMLSIVTIKFIELNGITTSVYKLNNGPALALAVLIVPLFDTLRVISLRILKKRSPFNADKNHLHHKIVGLGLNHIQATLILFFISVVFVVFTFFVDKYKLLNINSLFLIIFILSALLSQIPYLIKRNRIKNLRRT